MMGDYGTKNVAKYGPLEGKFILAWNPKKLVRHAINIRSKISREKSVHKNDLAVGWYSL